MPRNALWLIFGIIACSGGPREIPANDMARIMMQMLVDGKMVVNENPKDLPADTVAPYAAKAGFTAKDYAVTAERIDRDSVRAEELHRAMIDIIENDKILGYAFRKTVLLQDLYLEGLDSSSVDRLVKELDSNQARLN